MSLYQELVERCNNIIAGVYETRTQDEINNLMTEMAGFSFQLRTTGASKLLNSKTIDGVRAVKGWLAANEVNLVKDNGVVISNNTNVNIDIDINQAINLINNNEVLNTKDKDALELELSRLKRAAENKDEKDFSDKLVKALDIASKANGLVPTVVAAASRFLSLFNS